MPDITVPEIKEQQNLKAYNTLGIEAVAQRFASITTSEQLVQILKDKRYKRIKKFVLGGGSNILFASDFKGLVLQIAIKGIEKVKEDEEQVWIKAGAGEIWHHLVIYCVEKGWSGIENLSLIPGTVGAAPIQNIGAYGVELQDVFESLEAVNIKSGEVRSFSHEECLFGYRDSIFKGDLKGKYVITHVTLRLSKEPVLNTSYGAIQDKLEEMKVDKPTIKDVSNAVIAIRQSKLPDPKLLGNAGSFFKNPTVSKIKFEQLLKKEPDMPGYTMGNGTVKVPAGWLIEQTGWKGKVVGHTGTYRNQALVIVNHGGATGKEILDLAEQIRSSVVKKFDIELVPEVNII